MRNDLCRRLYIALIIILLTPLSAFAAVRTWTGAGTDTLWSNPANWDSGVPVNGDSVELPDLGVPISAMNDLDGLSLLGISSHAAETTLYGNRLVLGAGGVFFFHPTGIDLTLALPVRLSAPQRWDLVASDYAATTIVRLAGDVDLGTSDLSISIPIGEPIHPANCHTTIEGTITGAGNLSLRTGPFGTIAVHGQINTQASVSFKGGALYLDNTNSFPGPLSCWNGDGFINGPAVLYLEAPHALSPTVVVNLDNVQLWVAADTEIAALNGSGFTWPNPGPETLRLEARLTLRGAGSSSVRGFVRGAGSLIVTGGTHKFSCVPVNARPDGYSGSVVVTGGTLTLDSCNWWESDVSIHSAALKVTKTSLGYTTIADGTLEIVPPGVFLHSVAMDSSSTFIGPFSASSGPLCQTAAPLKLGGATLQLQPAGDPPSPAITIIENQALEGASGTFAGLPEGATITLGGVDYRISYRGGDGNDVVVAATYATQTTLTTDPNPSRAHRPVTLTASVTGAGGGTPSGIVKFFDGTTELGIATVDHPALIVRSLNGGTHSLTATYLGDAVFRPSTSPPVEQVVIQLPATTTALSAFPQPAPFGASVTLMVRVASAIGVPGGDVTFFDGSTAVATRTLDASGLASVTTPALTTSIGTRTLTAWYSGTDELLDSTSDPVPLVITRASAQVSLTSSPNPANEGGFVTMSASVWPAFGFPSGSVTFFDGATRLGSVNVDARGAAALRTSFSRGAHDLSASYSGNELLSPGTSAVVAQTVVPPAVPTTTELAVTPNPAWTSRPVALTATVRAGAAIPTGTVDFLDGQKVIGSAVLDADGKAGLTATLTAGLHVLGADFRGTLELEASSAGVVTVVEEPAATQTTLTASPNPSQHGQPVELSAVVRGADGVPRGTVTFSADGANLGDVPLDEAGRAFLTAAALADGFHNLVALYPGAGDYAASASSVLHEVRSGPATCQWPLFIAPSEEIVVPWQGTATIVASMSGDRPLQCEWYLGRYPDTTTEIDGTWIDARSSSVSLERLTAPAELWVIATNACGSAHAAVKITVLPKTRRPAVPH